MPRTGIGTIARVVARLYFPRAILSRIRGVRVPLRIYRDINNNHPLVDRRRSRSFRAFYFRERAFPFSLPFFPLPVSPLVYGTIVTSGIATIRVRDTLCKLHRARECRRQGDPRARDGGPRPVLKFNYAWLSAIYSTARESRVNGTK